jgi:hypothetical protein
MRRPILVTLALVFIAGAAVNAQTIDSLATGQSIRIWTRTLGTEGVNATVLRSGNDSVVVRLRKGSRIVAIPNDSVWRLEMRAGNHRGRGAVLGGLGGLVIGGAGGYLTSRALSALIPDCRKCLYGPLPSEKSEWAEEDAALAERVGYATAAAGAFAGAVWGSRKLLPRWTPVALTRRAGMRPSLHPSSSVFAVSFSLRF